MGYGVPDIERAILSAHNDVTLHHLPAWKKPRAKDA
jgi:hypothetical protein